MPPLLITAAAGAALVAVGLWWCLNGLELRLRHIVLAVAAVAVLVLITTTGLPDTYLGIR